MIIIIPAVFKKIKEIVSLLTVLSGLYHKRVHVLLELGVLLPCKIKLH